ncbi:MAG: hypothetical protein C4537_04320 [Acholeplasma sp.]|nr:MAG: hypothetical protein C4537_04320 [Acholeplasma sp.]
MNNVADFLTQVNQREDDRYLCWLSYRKALTDMMVKALSFRPNRDVLVIGSGALDDLEIQTLKPYTKTMTFLDLDRKATEEGILRQGLPLDAFHLIQQDITRFDDVAFFEAWHKKMAEKPSYAETILFVNHMMEEVYKVSLDQVIGQTFDAIIILPIYTQLIYHEWVKILDHTHPQSWTHEELNKVSTYLLDLMVPLIDHVNKGIQACLSANGDILVASDMLEWNPKDWITFEATYPNLSEQDLTEYYLSYVNQYGMGLGDYGLWSMKDGLIHHESRFLLWPLTKERTMLVQVMHLSR